MNKVRTGVRVSEEGGEGEDELEEGKSGRPVVFENVYAYAASFIDVHMIYAEKRSCWVRQRRRRTMLAQKRRTES